MQLSGADNPVATIGLQVAVDLEVVGSTIANVNESCSVHGRTDAVDHAAPDLRLAFAVFALLCVLSWHLPLRAFKQLLRGQTHDFRAVGCDEHRRVQQKTASPVVADASQAFDVAVVTEIEFGRIVDHQPSSRANRPSLRAMRCDHGIEGDFLLLEQPIGCFAIAPTLGLLGRCGVGLSCHLRCEFHGAFSSAFVSKLTSIELLFRPGFNVQRQRRHRTTSVHAGSRRVPPEAPTKYPPNVRGGMTCYTSFHVPEANKIRNAYTATVYSLCWRRKQL